MPNLSYDDWTAGLSDLVRSTMASLPDDLPVRLIGSLLILFVGYWLSRFVRSSLLQAMRRAEMEETLALFASKVGYYLAMTIVAVIVLANAGVPTTSVVAILGAGTLAIGLALQDSLANLASGVLLIFLKPFRVGDYVLIQNSEGFVTSIDLFHTVLRDRSNRVLYLPNKDVMDGNITNLSQSELIRLDLTFGISYEDDLREARRILEEIAAGEERIATEPAPVVAVRNLGESSVDFTLRPYVRVEDENAVTFTVIEQVKQRFDAAGISIPYPQYDVRIVNKA